MAGQDYEWNVRLTFKDGRTEDLGAVDYLLATYRVQYWRAVIGDRLVKVELLRRPILPTPPWEVVE